MPTYTQDSSFDHTQPGFTGVLLTNLGSPDAPTPQALRRYLAEFLGDPRIVEAPRWLWWMILHGIILRLRPRRSARSYEKIWQPSGSPLIAYTRKQAELLEPLLREKFGGDLRVGFAMRYGSPSIEEQLEQWRTQGLRRLVVLPLYPQYSATTTATTLDALSETLRLWRWVPELRFINHYHDHPKYIEALAEQIASARQTKHLIFSFHGIPQRYLDAGDPYFCHCHKTARLVAEKLGLGDDEWQLAFQSRFGREPWLQPYTDKELEKLAKRGTDAVDVVCPGFSADCLETLEEIAMENRELFLEAGGKTFNYIPALNDHPSHIDAISAIVADHAGDWLNLKDASTTLQASQQRATSLGAAK